MNERPVDVCGVTLKRRRFVKAGGALLVHAQSAPYGGSPELRRNRSLSELFIPIRDCLEELIPIGASVFQDSRSAISKPRRRFLAHAPTREGVSVRT